MCIRDRGRSCAEQILNLKYIILHRTGSAEPYVAVFLDFKKAYDSIHIEIHFKTLEELGVDDKSLSLIKEILTDT